MTYDIVKHQNNCWSDTDINYCRKLSNFCSNIMIKKVFDEGIIPRWAKFYVVTEKILRTIRIIVLTDIISRYIFDRRMRRIKRKKEMLCSEKQQTCITEYKSVGNCSHKNDRKLSYSHNVAIPQNDCLHWNMIMIFSTEMWQIHNHPLLQTNS